MLLFGLGRCRRGYCSITITHRGLDLIILVNNDGFFLLFSAGRALTFFCFTFRIDTVNARPLDFSIFDAKFSVLGELSKDLGEVFVGYWWSMASCKGVLVWSPSDFKMQMVTVVPKGITLNAF